VAEKKSWKSYDKTKDATVRARMDKDTVAQLDECCEKLKLTRSDIIRNGIQKIFDELPKE
jgi:antitoxin component of RelBE/YafQ-DinJ toxin-antitoxin module